MAIDVFQFQTQIQDQPQATINTTVRSVNYGDGYTQIAGDGINSEKKEWPLTFAGLRSEMLEIMTFLRAHTNKPFLWTDPMGERTTYIVDAQSTKWQVISRNKAVINCQFNQYYMGGVT